MNGPQHLIAANTALETAKCHSGAHGDQARFNLNMRLFEAHLAAAQFELQVAQAAASGHLGTAIYTSDTEGTQVGGNALSANAAAWIAAITEGGAK